MKSTTFALASLLASVAMAQPHRHHPRHQHNKRDGPVAWVTEWDYVTETLDVTSTVWVSDDGTPTTATSASVEASTTSVSSSASSTSEGTPGQFFQGQSSQTTTLATLTSSSSSSVYVAPTTSSTSVAPAPEPTTSSTPTPEPTTSSTSVYVAPTTSSAEQQVQAVQTPTSTSVYVAPTPTSTYVAPTPTSTYVAPVETTTSAAAVATTSASSSSSSSSSGVCTSGSPCSGDITYYEAGLGACGTTSDGSTENVVALPHGLMGTQSNGNPYCGKTITVEYNGKTTQATVVDKCMGCVGDSIDLSNAAFLELAELAVGRTQATWYFN